MKSKKMYVIVFGYFIIKLQVSVSEPQFPPHIDLQKVGEAIFNNEKFNILKPTNHRVTDHFKDFMLRTKSSYHPEKRVFIDNNGFRHEWSGFGEKTKSLRKTDLEHVSESFENASESKINSTDGNVNATVTAEDTTNNQEVEYNASDNNDTVQNLTEEDTEIPESKETTATLNFLPSIQKKNSSSKTTIEESLRQGKDNAKSKPAPAKKTVTNKKSKPTKKITTTKKAVTQKKAKPKQNITSTKKAVTQKKAEPKKNITTTKKAVTQKKAKPKQNITTTKKAVTQKKAEPTKKITTKKAVTQKKAEPTKKITTKKAVTQKKAESTKKIATTESPFVKQKDKAQRTVAKTTFFCPFFGTITMSSFID